ncbi:MAG: hypothetical protein Q7S84_01500 [bacterium]|nr:hypothetical protein [bacterium]
MVDVERFITGADEINRKRRVITRIITTITSLLEGSGVVWEFQETICHFQLASNPGMVRFIAGKKAGFIARSRSIMVEFAESSWWFNYGDSIPAHAVPAVYNTLPAIVEGVDAAVPVAKIKKHFEFFINQAPPR